MTDTDEQTEDDEKRREASPHELVQCEHARRDIDYYATLYGVRYPGYLTSVEICRDRLRKATRRRQMGIDRLQVDPSEITTH